MKRLFVILGQKTSMRKLVVTSLMVVVVLLVVTGCQTINRTGYYANVRSSNGSEYSGYWLNNKPHGQGTLTYANGEKYDGELRDGIPHGQGTYTYPNGRKYIGEWLNNKAHGQGTEILANGQIKKGIWKDGKFQYESEYVEEYVGEYKNSKRHGQGTLHYEYGGTYVGDFRNGKRHGQGTFFNIIGDRYVGEFRDDNKHGKGILTYVDGEIKEGIWKDGKFQYDQKGSPTVTARKSSPPPPSTVDKENGRLRKRIAELEKQKQSKPKQVAKKPSTKKSPPKSGSTGSGFFVSKLGHIITNAHVVRNCGSITVGDNAKKQVPTILLETDKRNDLALLKISNTQMASVETKSLIRKLGLKLVPTASEGLLRSEDVELGEDVLVSGYPYGEIYSDTIKVTKGIVSANKGIGDDTGQFQMDAAVQPGNSGGPIYDENGNIVGVVVSQLNKLKFAKAIGSLPENVNFGIKASTVRQFLTSSGLPTKWSNRSQRMNTKELAKIAKNQTVMVVCNP
jgi:S1-C subfamily serine protease